MAELKDGEKSWQKMIKPKNGEYTLQSLRYFLGIAESSTLHAHCKALGIELTPYVRKDKYVSKVYKGRYRFLTEEEAGRIIERHRMLQGRRLER